MEPTPDVTPRAALHLATAAAFACAQPLYDVLARSPEFFVAHGSEAIDIVALAGTLSLGVPAACVAVVLLAGLFGRRARWLAFLALLALLGAVATLPLIKRLAPDLPTAPALLAAAAAGALAAFAYQRWQALRAFFTYASPAVAIFPAIFLLGPGIRRQLFPRDAGEAARVTVRNPAPVVLIVFDQVTLPSLMDAAGAVDAARFPGFGELARDATWYRNTTTVSDFTNHVIPAILTGRRPGGSHPDDGQSLFTLFAGSHRLRAIETVTEICPDALNGRDPKTAPFAVRFRSLATDIGVVAAHIALPAGLTGRLPRVEGGWSWFTRQQGETRDELAELIASLGAGGAPRLSFLHTVRPHVPWTTYPSGKQYLAREGVGPHGVTGNELRWGEDAWEAVQGRQRYLLQLGHIDRYLAGVLARLKQLGTYDESLVVVMADHGLSFRAGLPMVELEGGNVDDVAFVPLFVKAPLQREAAVIDRPVETIDVLPTIADLLGAAIPWPVDGRSALRQQPPRQRTICHRGCVRSYQPSPTPDDAVREQQRQFAVLGHGPLDRLFAAGPAPELAGTPSPRDAPVSDHRLEVDESSVTGLELGDNAVSFQADLGAVVQPLQPKGVVTLPPQKAVLAIATNGTIQATTETYVDAGLARFSALLPESALRPGRNTLEAFLVSGPPGARRLERLAVQGESGYARSEAGLSRHGKPFRDGGASLVGLLESASVSDGILRVSGWAADASRGTLVERIVVFVGGQAVHAGRTQAPRPRIAKVHRAPALASSGFDYSIRLPADVSGGGRVDVYAVSKDGEAIELPQGRVAGGTGERPRPGTRPALTPGAVDGRVELATVRGGRLVVTGWAGTAEDGPASRVLIAVRGDVHEVTPALLRRRVAGELGSERLARSGFRLDLEVPRDADEGELADLRVIAVLPDGRASELPVAVPLGR